MYLISVKCYQFLKNSFRNLEILNKSVLPLKKKKIRDNANFHGAGGVPFVNCRHFMYLVISLLVLRAGCGI